MEQRHLQVVFKIFISMVERFPGQGGGGGTPFYKLYRCVRRQRVWLLSRFGLE